MDGGVKVSAEAENVSATSQCQECQSHLKMREAKRNKTADAQNMMRSSNVQGLNCRCTELDGKISQRAAEDLANALDVKVNLESENTVNGLTNGVIQGTRANEYLSDAKLLSGNSSPCDCSNGVLVHNGSSVAEQLAILDSVPIPSLDDKTEEEIVYVSYESELQMPLIMRIMNKDLSEPYSIYTYRYFIYNWPKLCFLAMIGSECVGAIVCKLDLNRKSAKRGYIAMLAVDSQHRNKGIGSNLVLKAIGAMVALNADEVVLESEITNSPALRLYENLGFVRDKRLFRYYLNGVDAFRLKLWLK